MISAAPLAARKSGWATALAAAGALALAAAQFQPPTTPLTLILQGALQTIVVVMAFRLRAHFAKQPAALPAWDALSFGLLGWLIGSAAPALLGYLFSLPSPSIFDLFHILGYPLIAFALWRYPTGPRDQSTRLRVLLDLIIVAGSAATIIYDLRLRPSLIVAPFEQPASVVWRLVYPALGLLITPVAIHAFYRPPPAALPSSLLLLALGVVITANFQPAVGAIAGQLLIGYGLLLIGAWPGHDLPTPGGRRARITQLIQRFLPPFAVLVVFIETTASQILLGRTDPTGLYLAILFSVLIVIRQGVLLGEVDLQRYARLVNSAADAAFVCRENGRLILANPAAYELLGLRPGSALGQRTLADVFQPFPPDTIPQIMAQALQHTWQGEGSAPAYDRPLTIALSLNPLKEESGATAGLVGVARDVTERRHMESKTRALNAQLTETHARLLRLNADLELKVAERTAHLEDANRQLEAKNVELQTLDQLKSEFVSLVSHELRAPLTNLNGGLELMLSRDDGMALRTREALMLMSKEARRLTRLVEAILDISALEAGQLPLRPDPMSLSALLRAITEQLQDTDNFSRLAVNVPETAPAIIADERGLFSVVYQLLDNAFKYAPESPVEISVRYNESVVELRVIDHGPGVPDEQRAKIFERFHRASQSDSQRVYGYGLGLYTSRRFLEGMGGQITLENTPGGGATFCVTLRRFVP